MSLLHQNAEISNSQTSNIEHQATGMKNASSLSQSNNGVKKRYEDIEKSPNDKRVYRGLILDNEMKVLLISDPSTDKSAAAMNVKIGYMSDPPELPGLAHFCEHMLFLGTEKYPNENEYNMFLSQHSGRSNAATFKDYTNYHMDVKPEQLDNVLDRFAQFFLNPLFTASATEREINAVHSEHEKNIPNDQWRSERLECYSSDPNHPYSKFGSGNKETLEITPKSKGINVREALLKFHSTWYSSNIMALSILGKESLDDLEKMVVSRFAQVENKKVVAPIWTEHPFKEEHFKNKWCIVPVKDLRYLVMNFPLPDLSKYYQSYPSYYAAHLLGHEGEGSLLAALRKAGWSDDLLAGERVAARGGCKFFAISVDLTEEGMKHTDDIITLLFQYINMLKKDGPSEWVFNEYKDLAKMNFSFKEKASPRAYVNSTAEALLEYPIEDVLTATSLITEWRPDLINLVLDHLTPDNIRVYVYGKTFEDTATETENWYGIKFKKEPIQPEVLDKWRNSGLNEDLVCPSKNEFIPRDFVIRSKQESSSDIRKFPVIIEDSPFMRVWFKQDDEFLLPKVNVMFNFVSPLAYMDPINYNLTTMYVQLIKDSLQKYVYNASLAGLNWDLMNGKYGIYLIVYGYHDKHRTLLEKVIDKMLNLKIDPTRFMILKEKYIRGLNNLSAEQPYEDANSHLESLLAERYWHRLELLDATEHISIENLRAFVPQLFAKIHVECLVHGNLTKSEALETVYLVSSELRKSSREIGERRLLPLEAKQMLPYREVSLDNGCHYLYQAENNHHKSSCTKIYYQTGLQTTQWKIHLELLAHIISEPCFNVLRTQEQLGYIVSSGIRKHNGVQGLSVTVQSQRHPKYVDERIELFMESMLEYITEMSDEKFDTYKDSLAALRLEKPKQMNTLSAVLWNEILTQLYNFDRANIEVAYLRTVTKDHIIRFFKEFLYRKSPVRRKLAVHVVSMVEGGAGLVESFEAEDHSKSDDVPVEIKDVLSFKASQSLYPLLEPFNGITRKGQRSKL